MHFARNINRKICRNAQLTITNNKFTNNKLVTTMINQIKNIIKDTFFLVNVYLNIINNIFL